jgi:HEAT repeat protein
MQPGGSDEWHPSALLYLAHALWRIQPDPRWPQAAIEVLSQAPHWVFRQEAVQALAEANEPAAVQALIKALDDAEPLVRHAAARGLLTLYGLPVDPADPQTMAIRVMSSDAARHDHARQEISPRSRAGRRSNAEAPAAPQAYSSAILNTIGGR